MVLASARSFNMPTVASAVPVETIPYITLLGSLGVGTAISKVLDIKNGTKKKKTEIIAEKVTFLSTGRKKEDEEEK